MPCPGKYKSDPLNDTHNFNINVHTREIYLSLSASIGYGEESTEIDNKVAIQYIKNLRLLDQCNNLPILTHMCIPGGDWSNGMAMFNAIEATKSPVIIVAYAYAESMSGILMQAADLRVMMPDAHLMLHYGSLGVDDNAIAASSYIGFCMVQNQRMLSIFAKRAKESPKFKKWSLERIHHNIDKNMKEKSDWYLTPEDAVSYGWADGIFGQKGYEDYETIKNIKNIRKITKRS